MLLFRFLTRKPWIYFIFGLAFLALILYSFYDVRRGGNIQPFEELTLYQGVISNVTEASQGYQLEKEDGTVTKINHYSLELTLPSGEQKSWRILTPSVLTPGGEAAFYISQQGQVQHLLIDGEVVIDYQNMAKSAVQKAQDAHEALVHPAPITFMLVLIFGGGLGQILRWRKLRKLRRQHMSLQESPEHIITGYGKF